MNVSTNLSLTFYIGNPTVGSETLENRAADCAPCADSTLSLKDQMKQLDDMELVGGNEDESDQTDDEGSLA